MGRRFDPDRAHVYSTNLIANNSNEVSEIRNVN